jgi:hypothetical protein
VHKPCHHPSDGTDSDTKLRRLLEISDGTMRWSLYGILPYVGIRRVSKKIRWNRRTTLFSSSTKTPPSRFWFFARLVDCSRMRLLGCTHFDITRATAPTPARSFGATLKEAMGIYLMVPVWYLAYVRIRKVSKKKRWNSICCRRKNCQ